MTPTRGAASNVSLTTASKEAGGRAEALWQSARVMERPAKIAILAAFAALYLIWGSTYLGILFAIQSIPPFLMAGVRFFLAGIIMFAIARFQGAPKPDPATWRDALIVGACLLLFGNGGVTVAEKWVPTGLAALLVATVPIYIALLGWITGTAPRPTPMVWLGLIGGFIGVGLLVGSALTNSSGVAWRTSRSGDGDPAFRVAGLVGRLALFTPGQECAVALPGRRPANALRRRLAHSGWRRVRRVSRF